MSKQTHMIPRSYTASRLIRNRKGYTQKPDGKIFFPPGPRALIFSQQPPPLQCDRPPSSKAHQSPRIINFPSELMYIQICREELVLVAFADFERAPLSLLK